MGRRFSVQVALAPGGSGAGNGVPMTRADDMGPCEILGTCPMIVHPSPSGGRTGNESFVESSAYVFRLSSSAGMVKSWVFGVASGATNPALAVPAVRWTADAQRAPAPGERAASSQARKCRAELDDRRRLDGQARGSSWWTGDLGRDVVRRKHLHVRRHSPQLFARSARLELTGTVRRTENAYSTTCLGSIGISRAVFSPRCSALNCRVTVPQQRSYWFCQSVMNMS